MRLGMTFRMRRNSKSKRHAAACYIFAGIVLTLLIGYADKFSPQLRSIVRDILGTEIDRASLDQRAILDTTYALPGDARTVPPLDVEFPYYLRLILPGNRLYFEIDPIVVNKHLNEGQLKGLHNTNWSSLYYTGYFQESFGYPFGSLGYLNQDQLGTLGHEHSTPHPRWYYRGIPLEPRDDFFGNQSIPIMLYPSGFAANTLIYAILLYGINRAWQLTIRAFRRKRGVCLSCGYDIQRLDSCPECNTTRT